MIQSARWAVITSLDVITEIMLLALPIRFISKNQTKPPKKLVVVFVFSFRLMVAAFSNAAMATYFSFLHSAETSIGASGTVAWQEILLGFSLISASIPCSKAFLGAFMSTGLMTVYGNNTKPGGSQGLSEPMSPQKSQNQSALCSQNYDDPQTQRNFASRLRPERLEYKVDVQSPQRGTKRSYNIGTNIEGDSTKSDGSERMIIHQTTSFEIARS